MPQLKRLSPPPLGPDASATTPEQLFTQPLHDLAQRALRKRAADACAAPETTMEAMLEDESGTDEAYQNIRTSTERIDSMGLAGCIHAAIGAARAGFRSLFIVSSAMHVVKRLRLVLGAEGADDATRDAVLRRIDVLQTREIHVLLSAIQDTAEHRLVFLGPLCVFFAPFLAANGLTATGDGLLRMVQLACKRCSQSTVTIIQPLET